MFIQENRISNSRKILDKSCVKFSGWGPLKIIHQNLFLNSGILKDLETTESLFSNTCYHSHQKLAMTAINHSAITAIKNIKSSVSIEHMTTPFKNIDHDNPFPIWTSKNFINNDLIIRVSRILKNRNSFR